MLFIVLSVLSSCVLANPMVRRHAILSSTSSVSVLLSVINDLDVQNGTRSIGLLSPNYGAPGAAYLNEIPATVFDPDLDSYLNRYPCTEYQVGTGDYAVNVWIYKVSHVLGARLIGRRSGSDGGGWELKDMSIVYDPNYAYFVVPTASPPLTFKVGNDSFNQWQMLTVVRASGVMTSYANGEVFDTDSDTDFALTVNGDYRLQIGVAGISAHSFEFDGGMRNYSFHNAALTAEQVAALYAEGIIDNPTLPNVISFYRMKPTEAVGTVGHGGYTYDANGKRYHKFTSSGTFTCVASGTFSWMVVGGGGSGGSQVSLVTSVGSGGGSGGDVVTGSISMEAGATYAITIGAGGTAVNGAAVGDDGDTTSIADVAGASATGGAGGGYLNSPNGRDGPNGGGASFNGTGGTGTTGYNGGNGANAGGGAAGDGQVGTAASVNEGGKGGDGTAVEGSTYGGGGDHTDGGSTGGAGGAGGGGAGRGDTQDAGTAGTENTGGGGGGCCAVAKGGDGGSGVAIIWYAIQ